MTRIALWLVALLLSAYANAPASAAKRAFVVGIAAYDPITPLKTPALDARRVADKLTELGYKVALVVDPDTDRQRLVLRWGEFLGAVDPDDEVVVYYSGHGVEIRGANYMVPRDVPKAETIKVEASLKSLLMPIDDWMQDLKDREVALAVLILDACRENPFTFDTKTLGGSGGLVPPGTRLGQFVFYAASAHETALTERPGQEAGTGSVFTRVFLEQFEAYKHRELRDYAAALKRPVATLADPHPQHPTYEDGLDDSWCFDGCASTQAPQVGVLAGDRVLAQVGTTAAVTNIVRPRDPIPPNVPATSFAANAGAAPPNAIFLGRGSSLRGDSQDCAGKVSDALPFGCTLLRQIAASQDVSQQRPYLHVPLRPDTDVNIRQRIPTVNEKSQGKYACVVGVLSPRDTTQLAGIVQIKYAGDEYYWGLLEASPRDCKR